MSRNQQKSLSSRQGLDLDQAVRLFPESDPCRSLSCRASILPNQDHFPSPSASLADGLPDHAAPLQKTFLRPHARRRLPRRRDGFSRLHLQRRLLPLRRAKNLCQLSRHGAVLRQLRAQLPRPRRHLQRLPCAPRQHSEKIRLQGAGRPLSLHNLHPPRRAAGHPHQGGRSQCRAGQLRTLSQPP